MMYAVLICCWNNLMKLEFYKLASPTIKLIFISALYLDDCVGVGRGGRGGLLWFLLLLLLIVVKKNNNIIYHPTHFLSTPVYLHCCATLNDSLVGFEGLYPECSWGRDYINISTVFIFFDNYYLKEWLFVIKVTLYFTVENREKLNK